MKPDVRIRRKIEEKLHWEPKDNSVRDGAPVEAGRALTLRGKAAS
jgi:hypothetical protein